MTATRPEVGTRLPGGVGDSPLRPDGTPKVTGEFAYASDLFVEGMLWGATARSPHPRARIRGLDLTAARAVRGVRAVLTAADVPGELHYGLEHADQPVLADGEVRYHGEPVAVVAADDPETARRAAALVTVDWEVLPAVTDMRRALDPDAEPVHPDGNLVRQVLVRRGDADAPADVVVTGEYEVGMQDQAFLGPESGVAVPAEDGGVELHVATQWLHADRRQLAVCLGLPADKVRLVLAGVGGAFGGREDLSMQVHACLLALRTGRPVKMVYTRDESFLGHVHRHPAVLRYEHRATADGKLVAVRADILLDGGAYTSTSGAVAANAATLGAGPYEVPAVDIDCRAVFTNNPPCGAMRGFGAVQACFAYESQMDKLAAACGLDPVEVRVRNAMQEGTVAAAGQVVDSAAPVAELLRRVEAAPLPPPLPAAPDPRELPGGISGTTRGEGVVRGVGYGVGIKNVGFSEGFDDFSTARVRLEVVAGEPSVLVHTAAAEVGQGLLTVLAQIARTELGVPTVAIHPADTRIGSGGSSSASRQTYVSGGAVQEACRRVRADVLDRAAARLGADPAALRLREGMVVSDVDGAGIGLAGLLDADAVEHTVEWRHRPTWPLDPRTGQVTGGGRVHVQYAFAAHRAVVDVDVELGLVRVVEVATAQDVGRAMHPQALLGQIHGGTTQGLGLAVMEEIQVVDGVVRNASFTDYLIPTILDTPPMRVEVLELADPHAPYGLRGVGEPPTISITPAVVAAIR
ncbi:MAG TPA: xanthine dehydrogenase subunit D, partial [Mycobacteriales bacterium]|nr:xanthine dehydrogenase subunit D [Mycobacteriales bacterium]